MYKKETYKGQVIEVEGWDEDDDGVCQTEEIRINGKVVAEVPNLVKLGAGMTGDSMLRAKAYIDNFQNNA